MPHRIKIVGQFKDPQVEIQMNEIVRKTQRMLDMIGDSELNLSGIYAELESKETKLGAQEKADQALESAKMFASDYANSMLGDAKNYTDLEVANLESELSDLRALVENLLNGDENEEQD